MISRTPLTPEQRALAERYWGDALELARARAERLQLPEILADSLIVDAATDALIHCVQSFREERKVKFRTFLHWRVRGAVVDLIRNYCGRGGLKLANQPISLQIRVDDGCEIGDLIESPTLPIGWEMEYHDTVDAVARRTSPQAARAFRLRYSHADFAKQSSIARAMGCTASRVSQLLTVAHDHILAWAQTQEEPL